MWDQGHQLVSIGTHIRNSLTIVLILLRFANCAWIPVFVTFVIAAGVDGKDFINFQTEHTSIVQIFTFGSTVAGFMLSWAVISSDYTAYFHPDVPRSVGFHGSLHHSLISTNQNSWRIFVYSYVGLTIPTVRNPSVGLRNTSNGTQITIQCLGAAAAITAPFIPNWDAGYDGGNVGGLIDAMLFPVGKFGKVLMVLLSLSVTTNNTPTIYSMGMALQTLIPPLVVVPRYVFSVLVTAL